MQTIFRLPWATEQVGERLDYQKPRQSPMVEIPYLNKFKRKRSDSADLPLATNTPETKRQKGAVECFQDKHAPEMDTLKSTPIVEAHGEKKSGMKEKSQVKPADKEKAQFRQAPLDQQPPSSSPKPENVPPKQPTSCQDTVLNMNQASNSLSETIQIIINQEILLKHRELRLIEQELAKCQISLEQIRRCQLIPYPGSQRITEAVSSGTGPAVEPHSGFTRPQYAAPWGVTDGPYARHYSKWLIPNTNFDSVSQQQLQAYNQSFAPGAEGRSLRGGQTADPRQSIGGKGRLSRISTGGNFQSLPADYPTPKEKAGPLIIKRASDGQLVKLVCTDCHRGNFSSAQGFLNHCRIAHHRDYKSHDAAAIACGQPVDPNEVSTPMETQQPSSATAPPSSNSQLVHPYITAEPPAELRAASRLSKRASLLTSSPFAPSPATPHLSQWLQRNGSNIDLAQLVATSREKVDIGSEPEESGDESELPTPARGVRPMTGVGVAQAPLDRPSSRKGHRQPQGSSKIQARSAPSRPTSLAPPRLAQIPRAEEIPETPELSPHTLESNPGLVSDRGEDDEDEDARSEHHPDPDGNVRMRDSNGSVKLLDGETDIVDDAGSDRELVGPRPKARKTELGQSSKSGRKGGR
ncbi:hypothetical protein EV356DRAFT_452426 [Viridothelium virens]|uniref:AHC1-like C2H2 zinc-finger domain-containing protein n=1 Tax=Viridothelium virens TaxID=1048519 RepID=A0A6A6H018_VIRVR|nr:hypothetical protein EV356DRAFT_452426 [Viridothelium virens]